MPPTIPDFDHHMIPVAKGVRLHAAVGGPGGAAGSGTGTPAAGTGAGAGAAAGSGITAPGAGTGSSPAPDLEPGPGAVPLVLLHGFPQTHLMWRHVAPALAADRTVICPDLRGYGASDKPAEAGPDTYSKRTMAADVVALVRALGYGRFAVAGHDRGALVAFRAGLDHPDKVTHLACLDVLPTLDMWDVMRGASAAVGFHLYLMAQPPGLPERLIGAAPDDFFGHFLDIWTRDPAALPADVRAAYLDACRAAVPSIVADYRASAGIDADHDRADREAGTRLRMPVAVLQQDWGAALGYDAAATWRAWAPGLQHDTVACGHFMAEESPATVTAALRALLTR